LTQILVSSENGENKMLEKIFQTLEKNALAKASGLSQMIDGGSSVGLNVEKWQNNQEVDITQNF
jgi:hypothetical protein